MQYGAGACRSQAAIALQNALKALGAAVGGDPALLGLAVDGFVGPNTTAAVNRAFTTHIGAGQAPAQFRTGALSMADVASAASTMAGLVSSEVARRGGSVPSAPNLKPPSSVSQATSSELPVLAPNSGSTSADATGGNWFLVGAMALMTGLGVYSELRGSGSRSGYRSNVIPFRRRA
jgi:peptidoglycan hydrolase-like protein with peptidoglycan-binding domain